LEAVAFLVLPLLTYLSHTRTRQSSTVALLFWLAYFPALLIWSRTVLLDVTRERILAVLEPRWGIGGLGIVAFALECLGPEFRAEPDDKPRLNPESPLLTANVFSVWTFGWLTPLMKKGVKQFITEDDLPELLSEEETAKVGQKLQRAMKKQYVLFLFYYASLRAERADRVTSANPCGRRSLPHTEDRSPSRLVSSSSRTPFHSFSLNSCVSSSRLSLRIKVQD
jgi:ATP-binding cassette subfamily C (CFTR/MRP) protein 1